MTTDFLNSILFRAVGIPLITVVVIIVAKMACRRDDATESFFEVFAVGPDLLIAALVAVPAFLTEKTITLKADATSAVEDKGKVAAEINGIATTSWLYLGVVCLAVIGFVAERFVKKTRVKGGWAQATFVGIVPVILLGAIAIAATFGLAR